MAQRALWQGSVSFGLVNIPVKLYVAAKDRVVEFHNLHAKCNTPLRQKRWCPKCGLEVAWEDVNKGYKITKDQYAVVTKKELASLALKSTRAIEVVKFVEAGQIDPLLVDKNYYLVPQEGGEKAYHLFREVLSQAARVAIGKVVFRQKEHLVALRPFRKGLVMTILHYKNEIIPIEQLEELKRTVIVKEAELKMAERLVGQLSGDFKLDEFRDEYVRAVTELIKEKVEGKEIVGKPAEIKPTSAQELMEALKESVAVAAKPAKKKKKK